MSSASQTSLVSRLQEASLEITVHHQDGHNKPVLLAKAALALGALLTAPVRKSKQSYCRVYDTLVSLEDQGQPIGQLRVILYLEDLGPKEAYCKMASLVNVQQQAAQDLEQVQEVVNELPSSDPKGRLFDELHDLEYKVIWELENWKAHEENKFKLEMKVKEADLL